MVGLQVTQLDHASILITDVKRSRWFYGDVPGLKEIAKPKTFDFVVVWFDLGNQHLHLLLKDRPDTLSPRHFALRVTDIQAARAHFAALHVLIQETTRIPTATALRSSNGCGRTTPLTTARPLPDRRGQGSE